MLRIRENQRDQNRYREIVACVLEERQENPSRDREKTIPGRSSSGKNEVQ